MSRVRNWAVGSAVAALILASAGVVVLMVIVVAMPINVLMNLLALALLSLTIVGALGWFVLQRQAALSGGDPHSEEPEHVPAPPM